MGTRLTPEEVAALTRSAPSGPKRLTPTEVDARVREYSTTRGIRGDYAEAVRGMPVRAAESLGGLVDLADAGATKVADMLTPDAPVRVPYRRELVRPIFGPEGLLGPETFSEKAGSFVSGLYDTPPEAPENLNPLARGLRTFGGESLATLPTLGLGVERGAVGITSEIAPRLAKPVARLGEAIRGGLSGASAEYATDAASDADLPPWAVGAVGAGAALTGASVPGILTGGGRALGGLVAPPLARNASRMEFASRLGVTPLAHEADDVLGTRLAHAQAALTDQIDAERANPALGRATTARTLGEAGFPGAEHLERSQAGAYQALSTSLGEQNLANRGAMEAFESRGGAPEVVQRAYNEGSGAVGAATDRVYAAYRALPQPPPIATDALTRARAEIAADAARGAGANAGSAKDLDDLLGNLGPETTLDNLEAVRTRLRVEYDKITSNGVVSDSQRSRYLTMAKKSIDEAIDIAADADATGALKQARAARRFEGALTDEQHNATRILRDKGYDPDGMMQNLRGKNPKELSRVIATLRQIPDKTLRESALVGMEELWLRNMYGGKSLSELSPAQARNLAGRLRDTKNPLLMRQARLIFGGRGATGAKARIEEVAQVLDRLAMLHSPQGDASSAYRTASGVGSDVFAEAARGGITLTGMAGNAWTRLRHLSSGRIDVDLNHALMDKTFGRALLDGITAADVREWQRLAVRKAQRVGIPTAARVLGQSIQPKARKR